MSHLNSKLSKTTNDKRIFKISGLASLIIVICAFITMLVAFTLGAEPSTASEYFNILNNDRLVGLLRLDFASMVNVGCYIPLFYGVYVILKEENQDLAALSTIFILIGVVLWFSTHSALTMIQLSDQFAAATTEAERSRLLAAGEAVLASDMYHSSAGAVGGILLLGGSLILSGLMIKSDVFGKGTAIVGLIGNGTDLLRVLLNLFLPGNPAHMLMIIAGPLFLVWFLLLGKQLLQHS